MKTFDFPFSYPKSKDVAKSKQSFRSDYVDSTKDDSQSILG